MTALSDCYKTITTVYGAGGEYYTNGHRGTDYARGARQAIIAYDDMRVTDVNYGTGLGYSVGLERLYIGGFAGYAHIWGGDLPEVGQIFLKGEKIALVAGWDDTHGTLWTGPHIHTTAGRISGYNCSVGIRPLYDGAADIAGAIVREANPDSNPAGGGSVPINNHPTRQGGGDMPARYILNLTSGAIGRFSDAGCKLFGDMDDYKRHLSIVKSYVTNDPQGKAQYAAKLITMPPTPTTGTAWIFGLSGPDFALEVAVVGGYI